jgi:ABC-2 type transport system ATP-binding protein
VLFLDEPTLGLDVTAQAVIRDFLLEYNRRYHATVLLTSHYMADVTELASRILVIDQGRLVFDGDLRALVERTAPYKLLRITLDQPVEGADLAAFGEVERADGLKLTLRVPRRATKEAAARALATLPVADVTIEDPPVEAIIREFFRREGAAHA